MKNVLYCVPYQRHWHEVAKLLKKRHSLQPKYWISYKDSGDKIKEIFPQCIYHDTNKAQRLLPPENYSNSFQYPLNKRDIENYTFEMAMSIKGMDRIDPKAGTGFDYDERVRSHFKSLMWWRNVLEDEDIDLVFFSRPPHTPDQYSIYIACKQTDTKTIMLKEPLPLPDVIYSQEDVGNLAIKDSSEAIIPDDIEERISDIECRESKSKSIREIRKDRVKNYINQIKKILRYSIVNPIKLGEKRPYKSIKKPEKDLEESVYSYLEVKFTAIKRELRKIKLQKSYNNRSEKIDYSNKFVYFPLQYQPELSTNPKAGMFVHQYLVANLVSCCLAEDTNLVIKEHPVTLFSRRKSHGRNTYDYKHLSELDSVKFADIESSQMKLIDEAEAVVTMTGTPGWEGIIRGTPALIFGNAWYRQCEGAHYIESKEDIQEALEEIKNNSKYGPEDARDFIRRLLASSSRGYINESTGESTITVKENIQNIVKQIEKYIE